MPKQVRWRRGTTAEHATFTGAQGEVTVDITKKTLVVHDGVTPGGWPVNNTPGGSASGQALAISAAGTDTITPGASVLNHFVDATVSAGAGAYVRKLVLSHVGAADGKRIAFHFTLPASANPVIELRDGTATGTVLLAFSPRPDAAVPRSVDCEHRGGAWRLVDSNEVADKIRESILDAKGRLPVRGASEVVALPAPARGQMLVGNPDAPEGMNWTGVETGRESLLNLYRERVVNPSPLPVAAGANSIALGAGAYARGAGMIASANGGFNDQAATLQRWAVLLRNQTTDATQTELFADGASQRLVLPDNYTWHFEVRVVAREQGGESAAYHFMGCIKRGVGAASTALVGSVDSPMGDKEDAAGWGVVVDADTTNGALRVRVTGGASQTLRWGADVSVVEVFNTGVEQGEVDPPAPVQSPGLVGQYYNESDGYDATIKGFQLNSHGILPNGTDLVQFQQQNPPVPQFGVEPPVFTVLFTIMARPFSENPPDLSGLPDPEPDNAFAVEMPGMALNLDYDGQPENLLARWMWTLESYVFVTFNWDWFNASDLSKFNVYCKVRSYVEGQALGAVLLLKTPGAPEADGGGNPPPSTPAPPTVVTFTPGGSTGMDLWNFDVAGNTGAWSSYRVFYQQGATVADTSDPSENYPPTNYVDLPDPSYGYAMVATLNAIKAAAIKSGFDLGPVGSCQKT